MTRQQQPPAPSVADLLFPRVGHRPPNYQRRNINLRPPDDLRAIVAQAEERGHNTTDAVLRLARLGLEAAGELGLAWSDVERYAAAQHITHGAALGRLARAAAARKR